MSDQASLMLAYEYRTQFRFQAQQMPSMLEQCVLRGMTEGEKTRHELLGKVTPVERTSRHQDTPYTPTPHDDRWSVSRNFGASDLIDKFDKLRAKVQDPQAAYARAQVAALNRQKDSLITSALGGTAVTGQTGTGTSSFDSNMQVAVDSHTYDEAGGTGNAGLTYYKILEALTAIQENTGSAAGRLFGLMGAREMNTLIASTKTSSTLYVGEEEATAFRTGKINTLLGVQWKLLEDSLITTDGSSNRLIYIWTDDACALDMNEDLNVTIDRRADKWNAWQILTDWTMGAVRLDNLKVAEIACHPTTLL